VGGSGARAIIRDARDEGRWLRPGIYWKDDDPRHRPYDAHTEPSPTIVANSTDWGWCWTRPATTINADPRVSAPGHHDPNESGSQQRDAVRVTLNELAALQGFPPGFTFHGNQTEQARQIGNAVPPRMAQVIAEANRPAP
jgi:site-specific DNA-cytosine methylase